MVDDGEPLVELLQVVGGFFLGGVQRRLQVLGDAVEAFVDRGLKLGMGVVQHGDQGIDLTAQFGDAPLGRLNGSLKGASVAVTATNLLNKDYLSTCDAYYCYYGDERSVVASATYKF